jgi:hypothetical protein
MDDPSVICRPAVVAQDALPAIGAGTLLPPGRLPPQPRQKADKVAVDDIKHLMAFPWL